MSRICRCGHGYQSHFESTDDGAGCVVCRDCLWFSPEVEDDEEREAEA